ncbi:MAG: hypothetical protein OXI43_09815, partial [Candidatus Poribacteria bacterium]|nr:hypothetical protein [Candidatus Poribacteria bacterium]
SFLLFVSKNLKTVQTIVIFSTILLFIHMFCCDDNIENDFIGRSSALYPFFIGITATLTEIIDMAFWFFDRQKKYYNERIKEVRSEGKAEGKAEEREKWVEWAENGQNPDMRPDKVVDVDVGLSKPTD